MTSVHELATKLTRSGSIMFFLSSFEVMCVAVGSLDASTLVSFLCVKSKWLWFIEARWMPTISKVSCIVRFGVMSVHELAEIFRRSGSTVCLLLSSTVMFVSVGSLDANVLVCTAISFWTGIARGVIWSF